MTDYEQRLIGKLTHRTWGTREEARRACEAYLPPHEPNAVDSTRMHFAEALDSYADAVLGELLDEVPA